MEESIAEINRLVSELEDIYPDLKVSIKRDIWGNFEEALFGPPGPNIKFMLDELRDECSACNIPFWVINFLDSILEKI